MLVKMESGAVGGGSESVLLSASQITINVWNDVTTLSSTPKYVIAYARLTNYSNYTGIYFWDVANDALVFTEATRGFEISITPNESFRINNGKLQYHTDNQYWASNNTRFVIAY